MKKLTVGKVRTSTGVKGFFKVLSHSGETSHFKNLKGKEIEFRFDTRTKNLKIEDVVISGSVPLLKVVGIDSPEEAKKLSGWEIYVDRKDAAPLNEKEYYHADLCDCAIIYDNEKIGDVRAVCENGASDMLEVNYKGKTVLVPFLDRFIGSVDLKKNTIELKENWFFE